MRARAAEHLDDFLRLVGIAVWLVVGAPSWTLLLRSPEEVGSGHPVVWSAVYLAFLAAFLFATSPRAPVRRRLALLLFEAFAATALCLLGMPHFEGALFTIAAAQAPSLMRPGRVLLWDAAQAAVLFPVILPSHGALGAAKAVSEYLTFSLVALSLVYLRDREASARKELARTNAALLGMQSLLADDARTRERLRVAREVHDAVGHGLTAASLHLQLASRAGGTSDAVIAAQGAVKATLAEVRRLVRGIREETTVDLGTALRALCAGIREPDVRLRLPNPLLVTDPAQAHALFRCAQEALTNAIRHSRAAHLWIEVDADDGIVLTVRDDGVGTDALAFGSGLEGLRERLAEVSGTLDIETRRGAGLTLRARLAAPKGTT